ncbi:MAG TPA: OpcA/G6PD domain-containing protein, partial [Spirochaetia bacterium]|nr:OpcA/G6PD domain-containing protein [Spirochaetia bacterium]
SSGLSALRTLKERTAGAFLLSDFSWRRSRILREQTARAFDPPSMRPLLASVQSVRLYGASEFEASLFFLWLRVRLGRQFLVEHAAAGALAEGFRVTFKLAGAPELDIGCTKGGCLSRGEEKGAYRFPSDGEILLEEVDTLSRDPVFVEVLAHAGSPDD